MEPNTSGLLNNPILDTLIALGLVYALLSILVSLLLEWWNSFVKERGAFLQKVVFRILDDPLNHNFGYLLYQHPIISKMRKDGNSYPYYISAESFSNALLDTVAQLAVKVRYEPQENGDYAKVAVADGGDVSMHFVQAVNGLRDSEFKRLMRSFIERHTTAGALHMENLKAEIGRWFDDHMDRAGGEYKGGNRGKLRVFGLVVALALNVDSIHLARTFFKDKDLRDRMVQEAESVVDAYEERKKALGSDTLSTADLVAVVKSERQDTLGADAKRLLKVVAMRDEDSTYQRQMETVLARVESWQLPIGWSMNEAPMSWFVHPPPLNVPDEIGPAMKARLRYHSDRNAGSCDGRFVLWVLGILVSAFSLSMGAPFWFEALVRLINIRRAGAKPERQKASTS